MTTVFDSMTRTETGFKKRADSIFRYLNISMRPGSEASRALIEDLFARVPVDVQQDLRSRFRSGSDAELASVFQELCLHDLLSKQLCELLPHPCVTGTTKRPDFRVLEPEGMQFFLEARSSTKVSSGPSSSPRGDQVRDFLTGFKLDGFLIGVDELVAGSKDLSRRLLVRHINESLKTATAKRSARVLIPAFETEDGWKIRLTAVSDAPYGSKNGGVLYEAWGRTWDGPSHALPKALIEKGGRYGDQLGMPFVIAINSFDPMLTDRDFAETLFGERGFWGTPETPQYRRVSAVLFTVNLWPATLLMGHVESRLYLNPFAHWSYEGVLTKLDTFRFARDSWRRYPGSPLYRLLQLRLHDSSLWD